MAGSVNKVILVGHLGRDPEVRSMQDGRQVCNLAIATSESWKDKQTGERKEKTEWHRVVIFSDGLVNVAKQYLKKGSQVYLEGALQTRKWTDNAGVEKYTTEIVLQGFNSAMTILTKPQGEQQDYQAPASKPATTAHDELNDSIPFAILLPLGFALLSVAQGFA